MLPHMAGKPQFRLAHLIPIYQNKAKKKPTEVTTPHKGTKRRAEAYRRRALLGNGKIKGRQKKQMSAEYITFAT